MTLELLAGASVGAGVLLLVLALSRPVPGVAATLHRLDDTKRSRRQLTASGAGAKPESRINRLRDGVGDRLAAEAATRGWQMTRMREDLAVTGRALSTHLGTKALLALGAFVWLPAALWLVGLTDGAAVPAVAALVAGAFGYILPDLQLRREAESRRRDFRHVTGAFLDLVAMNLAGGRGLPEALVAASSFGDHWAMVRLRQALSNARIMGWTPWEGIARLGRELGVEELRDLASALALAGDEGARIRLSLMARAESMRRKEMVDIEGRAGENSQSMLMAQLLMCVAFLVFLAYPAVSRLG
jgi:Flp pilus assembly protein TadB